MKDVDHVSRLQDADQSTGLGGFRHNDRDAWRNLDALAHRNVVATHESLPRTVPAGTKEEHLDSTARVHLPTDETTRQHPTSVDDDEVAGSEEGG
jgi:hypothetical protein